VRPFHHDGHLIRVGASRGGGRRTGGPNLRFYRLEEGGRDLADILQRGVMMGGHAPPNGSGFGAALPPFLILRIPGSSSVEAQGTSEFLSQAGARTGLTDALLFHETWEAAQADPGPYIETLGLEVPPGVEAGTNAYELTCTRTRNATREHPLLMGMGRISGRSRRFPYPSQLFLSGKTSACSREVSSFACRALKPRAASALILRAQL